MSSKEDSMYAILPLIWDRYSNAIEIGDGASPCHGCEVKKYCHILQWKSYLYLENPNSLCISAYTALSGITRRFSGFELP